MINNITKSFYVIQRDKNSRHFATQTLSGYDILSEAHLFKTQEHANSSLDPNNKGEVVRRVKVTFELED